MESSFYELSEEGNYFMGASHEELGWKLMGRILYMTDKYKVSDGYQPAFRHMVQKCGIKREEVLVTDIYNLVQDPLIHKGNEKIWRYDPAKLDEASMPHLTNGFAPLSLRLIVVSCPAITRRYQWRVTGQVRLWKRCVAASIIMLIRPGCYCYLSNHGDQSDGSMNASVENEDGEVDRQEPYKVKSRRSSILPMGLAERSAASTTESSAELPPFPLL
jgi:hypothetical protein